MGSGQASLTGVSCLCADSETGREEEDVCVRRSRSGSPGYPATQGQGRQDQVNILLAPHLPPVAVARSIAPFVVPRRETPRSPSPSRRARLAPLCLAFCSYPRIVSSSLPLLSSPPLLSFCVCLSLPCQAVTIRRAPLFPCVPRPDPIPLFSLSHTFSRIFMNQAPHTCPRPTFAGVFLTPGNSVAPLCSTIFA